METVKEINLEQLENQYGYELRREIEIDIDYCQKKEQDWKFEVVNETKNFITFAFATGSYSRVYEVSKNKKNICEKYLIGSLEGKKIIDLMNSFEA